jgi:hypothetical protein
MFYIDLRSLSRDKSLQMESGGKKSLSLKC